MTFHEITAAMLDGLRWLCGALARTYWFVIGIILAMGLANNVNSLWFGGATAWIAFVATIPVVALVMRQAFAPRRKP